MGAVLYVIEPDYLWGNISEMARRQDDELLNTLQDAFKYIENESFDQSIRIGYWLVAQAATF